MSRSQQIGSECVQSPPTVHSIIPEDNYILPSHELDTKAKRALVHNYISAAKVGRTAKEILRFLLGCSNKKLKKICPSNIAISKNLSISKRQVQHITKKLEDEGYLIIFDTHKWNPDKKYYEQTTNTYHFTKILSANYDCVEFQKRLDNISKELKKKNIPPQNRVKFEKKKDQLKASLEDAKKTRDNFKEKIKNLPQRASRKLGAKKDLVGSQTRSSIYLNALGNVISLSKGGCNKLHGGGEENFTRTIKLGTNNKLNINKTPMKLCKNINNDRAKIPEEFVEFFKDYSKDFSPELDERIKRDFVRKFQAQTDVTLSELKLRMKYFACDIYLLRTTKFPDRLLSHFGTAVSLRDSKKKKLQKASCGYDPSIIPDDCRDILQEFHDKYEMHQWLWRRDMTFDAFKKAQTFIGPRPQKNMNQTKITKIPVDTVENLPAIIEVDQSVEKLNEFFKWKKIYELEARKKRELERQRVQKEKLDQMRENEAKEEEEATKLRSKVFEKARLAGLDQKELGKVLLILAKFPKEPKFFESFIDLSGSKLIRAINKKGMEVQNAI